MHACVKSSRFLTVFVASLQHTLNKGRPEQYKLTRITHTTVLVRVCLPLQFDQLLHKIPPGKPLGTSVVRRGGRKTVIMARIKRHSRMIPDDSGIN